MKQRGISLIEIMIVIALAASLYLGTDSAITEMGYWRDAKKVQSIAMNIDGGMREILSLKNSNGCNNPVPLTHSDLITVKVPLESVYPTPWTTNFSFINKGGTPTENLVAINIISRSVAENIFSYSGGDSLSGSVIYYRFPLNNLSSDFNSMYKNNTNCWEYGSGSK